MDGKVLREKRIFLDHIHYFRGLSILLIVASHVLVESGENVLFYRILSALFLNSTLFFVFVSGFLFRHLSYKYNAAQYWRRKLETIVLPYIIISIPAIVLRVATAPPFYTLANYPDFASWPVFLQIGYYYGTGAHLLPYWYIPMIVLYFAISPLLVYLDKKDKFYYLLPIFVAISLLLPRDNINEITHTFRMFTHFFSVYVLGMFVSRYQREVSLFATKYWIILISAASILFIASCFPLPYFEQIVFIQKLFFCIVIIRLFEKYLTLLPRRLLGNLALYSFGIYFLHYYVILVLRGIAGQWLGHEKPINFLEWVIFFTAVILATYGIVFFAKMILGKHSRKFIGS